MVRSSAGADVLPYVRKGRRIVDDLAFLNARIPGYAGYGDESNRHLVDSQVRAWLGAALARLRERLAPAGPLAERLETLIFRCEFADQRVIRATDHDFGDGATMAEVYRADRAVVELADRAEAVGPSEAEAFISEGERALDTRSGVLTAAVR